MNDPATTTTPATSNGYATIDDLVAASKKPRRFRDVELPVSRLKLKIQSLTEREKSRLETEAMARDGMSAVRQRIEDARRRLILACVVEPKLERHHIEMLGDFDGADLSHLHTECARHCGWSESDVESMEKNSGTATVTD